MNWLFIIKIAVFISTAALLKENRHRIFEYSIGRSDSKAKWFRSFIATLICIMALAGFYCFLYTIYQGLITIDQSHASIYNNIPFGDLLYFLSVIIFGFVIYIFIKVHINELQTNAYNRALLDIYKKRDNLKSESDWEEISEMLSKNKHDVY